MWTQKHCFSVTALGLLLWAVCVHGNETTKGTPREIAEKTTDIKEEDNVLILHSINLDRALVENPYVLVKFDATWCEHSRAFQPAYLAAAETLKKETSVIRLAKVDATEEHELVKEFNIKGIPTLKLFVHGDRHNPIDYVGGRTAEALIKWLKDQKAIYEEGVNDVSI